MRIGIRLKLAFLSLFLFAIPWLGYQYVWELETYLRQGQEQTMLGTARAVATALHERPSLFDSQSAYLSDVTPGTDLYAHKINRAIQLDGRLTDWQDYQHLALSYADQHLIRQRQPYTPQSLLFTHMVGQYRHFLYAMFEVTDNQLVFRPKNSLRVDRNDHLLIAMTSPSGEFERYIVAPISSGWVNAYRLADATDIIQVQEIETRIQGHWQQSDQGYNIELRFPLEMTNSSIAFALVDVDDPQTGEVRYSVGTADPHQVSSLGTVLVPSPQIENILRGLKYSNSRVWVVDKHMRVLARSGSIQSASGIHPGLRNRQGASWWTRFEQDWILPLYYKILTRPPTDFIDELDNAYSLTGSDLQKALNGEPASTWRLTPDNKALILSATHPIFIDEKVMGAVVVEQTTHGIRTLRNRALEQLFHVIIAVVVLGSLAMFIFASRMSIRISRLRNETENAIDTHGKIVGTIKPSTVQDEIGDLSRTFHNVLGKLSQYNQYLENMSSRLSHELRTPVAIVNSSLEMLALNMSANDRDETTKYITRAQQGIRRLSDILSRMSEATRLEQAIERSEKETFNVTEVVRGCCEGYKLAYPTTQFKTAIADEQVSLAGSPELFAQMLDKIVANAVEFHTPESDIHVMLVVADANFTLSISNLGPTLPENMQDQLLNSMVSIRNDASGESAHLGLGLYVANLIAEFHQCRIELSNQTDQNGVIVTVRNKPQSQ